MNGMILEWKPRFNSQVVTEEHLLSHSLQAPTSSKDLPSVPVSSMAFTVRVESLSMATEGLYDLIVLPLFLGAYENLCVCVCVCVCMEFLSDGPNVIYSSLILRCICLLETQILIQHQEYGLD